MKKRLAPTSAFGIATGALLAITTACGGASAPATTTPSSIEGDPAQFQAPTPTSAPPSDATPPEAQPDTSAEETDDRGPQDSAHDDEPVGLPTSLNPQFNKPRGD